MNLAKKYSTFFLFVCLYGLLVLSSCKNENSHHPDDKFVLNAQETILLPLDSAMGNICERAQTILISSQKEYFYATQPFRNKINVYNLNTKEKIDEIPLMEEGPDGIGRFVLANIFDKDSMLELSFDRIGFTLMTSKGKIVRQFPLIEKGNSFYITTSGSVLLKHRDAIVFIFAPPYNQSENRFDLNSPIFAFLSPGEGVTKITEIKYPSEMAELPFKKQWQWNSFVPGACINGDLLVYTIPALDSIYTYNLITKEKRVFEAKSRYKTKKNSPLKAEELLPVNEIYTHDYQSFHSKYILYDKNRGLYYRINLLPKEPPARIPQNGTHRSTKRISVQIFDGDFNCVGETLLPDNKHNNEDIFIGAKGLYISNNNPDNPDYQEDYLNYTLYVLVPLQK